MAKDPAPPLQLEVHGARGSSAVSGPQYVRHGGNTSCFSVRLPDGHVVIIDCGSGIGRLQTQLAAADALSRLDATILLTHFHWDHIEGLPTFAPLYESSTRLRIVATPPEGMEIGEALGAVIRPPWFPVPLVEVPARISYEPVGEGPLQIGPIEIRSARLRHPAGVNAYRLEHDGGAIVIATDTEAGDPASDEALRALARGATVLVHDAQYLPDEYENHHHGWGHSTWERATEAALQVGVKRLVLTSHDPRRTDDQVDAIVETARGRFPATEAAREGLLLEF